MRRPALALLVVVPLLFGFDYGSPILIRSEEDIYELQADGELDEGLVDQLVSLFEEPLDLNEASREELQLLPGVTYAMADAIIARRASARFTGVEQLRPLVGLPILRQLRPFVTVPRARPAGRALTGTLAIRTLEQFKDDTRPVVYVKARQKYHKWLDSGVILAEQEDLWGWDYTDEGIEAQGYRPKVSLERAFVMADRGSMKLMAGNYAVGFGQRLTFDVTDKQRPYGIQHDLNIYEDYENYDSYRVGRRLLGVAGTFSDYLGDAGWRVDTTVFASVNPIDTYYTDVSPHEIVALGDEEIVNPRFPRLYREDLLGMNTSLFWSERDHVGVTAWGGRAVKQYDYEFTGLPIPNRPFYGAVGVDTQIGIGGTDLYAEVAVTDQGGVGAWVEGVVNPKNAEISLAMRYYGTNFDNPHSRGRSEPDQVGYVEDVSADDWSWSYDYAVSGGKNDTDEFGPRLTTVFDPLSWLRVRVKGDLWRRMTLENWNAWGETRVDVDPLPWLGFDLLSTIRDKDISAGGREEFYDTTSTRFEDADERGQKVGVGGGLRVAPVDTLVIQAFAKQNYQDVYKATDPYYDEHYEKERYAWAKMSWDLTDDLNLAMRGKLYQDRPEQDDSGKEEARVYGQLRVQLPHRITVQGRYEQVHDLDEPDAEGNPERKVKFSFFMRY